MSIVFTRRPETMTCRRPFSVTVLASPDPVMLQPVKRTLAAAAAVVPRNSLRVVTALLPECACSIGAYIRFAHELAPFLAFRAREIAERVRRARERFDAHLLKLLFDLGARHCS